MADKKKKPNWIKIRNEYETIGTSYRKLAEKYSVSFNTLKDRAIRELWSKRKDETHNKIATKTQQKTIEKISDEVSEINASHFKTWQRFHQIIETALESDKITTIEPFSGRVVEVDRESKDIENLAKAFDKLQKGQRLAKNILSKDVIEKIAIEREKLAMEKKKVEQEEKQDNEIRIVMEGDMEAWSQ